MRDRDVRNAIFDALTATNEFSTGGVWITGLPEDSGSPASEQCAVAIEPNATRQEDLWDAAADGELLVTSTIKITVLYRGLDIQLRDEAAERLIDVVRNALNGNGFGGMTLTQTARVAGWTWLPTTTPERRITTMYSYQYLEPGWQTADETP
jgi:hypothetical protein